MLASQFEGPRQLVRSKKKNELKDLSSQFLLERPRRLLGPILSAGRQHGIGSLPPGEWTAGQAVG